MGVLSVSLLKAPASSRDSEAKPRTSVLGKARLVRHTLQLAPGVSSFSTKGTLDPHLPPKAP